MDIYREMKEVTDHALLTLYARENSQTAFATLVGRYLNLVYSVALRHTRNPHAAEEIAQVVFLLLANKAGGFSPKIILTGWLYQTARLTATNYVRNEIRRQNREHKAQMEFTSHDPTSDEVWEEIAPHLDEAMAQLRDQDRDALLCRFFGNKTLREVGQTLGLQERAAQKRVDRGLEKLRLFFARRGVTLSAASIATAVMAHSVQAAPSNLGALITHSLLSGTTLIATAATTFSVTTKTIVMTTLQKTIVTLSLIVVAGIGVYEARLASNARAELAALKQNQAPLAEQLLQLQRERDVATNRVASLTETLARAKKNPEELLQLRGQVSQLRQENAQVTSGSALNQITANPETRKAMRDQQKMGMTAIYADFLKNLKLPTEQAAKFNDLLADHVMENIDRITEVLRDKKSPEETERVFANQEAALREKLQELVGPEGVANYEDYTKNLGISMISSQITTKLTGEPAVREEKKRQLLQLMQTETQSALANAGLPADYQIVPMLNFRNIASEQQGEASLKLLDGILQNVASKSSGFLSPEERAKMDEFRTNGVSMNRSALTMNRKLMAPLAK